MHDMCTGYNTIHIAYARGMFDTYIDISACICIYVQVSFFTYELYQVHICLCAVYIQAHIWTYGLIQINVYVHVCVCMFGLDTYRYERDYIVPVQRNFCAFVLQSLCDCGAVAAGSLRGRCPFCP
jgi:hypothetical protein